jgi:cell division protein FtsB
VFENNMNHNNARGETFTPTNKQEVIQDELFANAQTQIPKRKPRRSLPKDFNNIEFAQPTKRTRKRTTGPKVNYVKSVKKKKRAGGKSFEWSWSKIGWLFCGALILRIFFMDSGILDYHSMNQTLDKKQENLIHLREENASIIQEIHKIKTSQAYQKKLARDHLGVIAEDEYLVLFSKDAAASSF